LHSAFQFHLHPTPLQLLAWWVPGEEWRGIHNLIYSWFLSFPSPSSTCQYTPSQIMAANGRVEDVTFSDRRCQTFDKRLARRAKPCLRTNSWGSRMQAASLGTWLSTRAVNCMQRSARATMMLFRTCWPADRQEAKLYGNSQHRPSKFWWHRRKGRGQCT
jgi:hypothetical protein